MIHKQLTVLFSASILCAVLAVASAPAIAQDINYDLPSAETIQERKDTRQNKAVSDRVGRRIMAAFEMYSEEENVQGAIAELEEASPRDPFDVAYVNRFLGNLYAANDQMQKALDLTKGAADADVLGFTDHEASLKLTADLSLQLEKYSQAIEYYGKWLQFTGEYNADVFLRIANAYYEMKQFDKVIKPANMAIQYYQEPNKNPYILKIASYYERKMYSEAIEVLENGLNVLPGEKVWWNQLGMMYMLEENVEKALQTLEIAYLAGYFDKESQYRSLVQLYSNNEIPYKSASLMEKHLANGDIDESARNYQSAANNYEAAKEYDRAAEMYGKAAELEEDREGKASQYRRQGTAYLRAENYSRAAQAYLRAIELGYDDPGPVYMSLAESYFYANNFSQALTYIKEAQKYDEQRRNARSWEQYIRQKAKNRGVSL